MRILLLAGTGEANALARALVDRGHHVLASLAGATRAPKALPCETRIGGFGGAAGFKAVLSEFKPELVLDATHPFAHRISRRSFTICKELDIPYLQLLRPKWSTDETRGVYEVADARAARQKTPAGARVFLATGRQTLLDFEGFEDCTLICRQIDPPDAPFPFPNGDYLIGRPPFSVADEKALFSEKEIDVLIVKNAGGQASYSKIEAAIDLGIPVLMLARPNALDAPQVGTVSEALSWVERYARH
ncbi:MAG: cobalt-precorrin-6A reductase [Pseudomonadota bacterium]